MRSKGDGDSIQWVELQGAHVWGKCAWRMPCDGFGVLGSDRCHISTSPSPWLVDGICLVQTSDS
ncbi:hypothetical protein V6Z12_D05G092000 [Gossypium hirsutum]